MKYLMELTGLFLPSKEVRVKTETLFVIKDKRMFVRYLTIILTCAGIFAVISKLTSNYIVFIVILIGIPGIIFLLITDLTVTADRKQKILTLDYRSILIHWTKKFPFADVMLIGIQCGENARSVPATNKYRLAVETKYFKSKPFRLNWSTDEASIASVAVELNEFMGFGKKRQKKGD